MGISCFGNFSISELGDVNALGLNTLKALDFGKLKLETVDGNRCVIPGFAPPALPGFAIPPIPIFEGIPPISLGCLLPPFPGIPGLSLPGISIPLIPIPYMMPIPLPIPGFALPSLPTLPTFNLGSLSFLCGLLSISLPTIDIFGGLNQEINKINALISAFNDFLQFCKLNAEAISELQVPPDTISTISNEILIDDGFNIPPINRGIITPTPKASDPSTYSQTRQAQPRSKINLNQVKMSPEQDGEMLAEQIANEKQIPLEPGLINKVKQNLAGSKVKQITTQDLNTIANNNNIPSYEGFIGFRSEDICDCVESSKTTSQLINCLVSKKLLADNKNIKNKAHSVLSKVIGKSCTEIANALNSSGVPYGPQSVTLQKITRDDIANGLYIQPISTPPTPEKIINSLLQTGIIARVNDNSKNANRALTPLPQVLTPTILEQLFIDIIPGPAIGSLRGACIASTQQLTPQTITLINQINNNQISTTALRFKSKTILQTFSSLNFTQFQRLFDDIEFVFPASIYDIIPILSAKFEIDDYAFVELFSQFNFTSQFGSLSSLYNFLTTVFTTIQSQKTINQALKSCNQVDQATFNFDNLVRSIAISLKKHGLVVSSATSTKIASALKIENQYDYLLTLNAIKDVALENVEQLTFLLVLHGVVKSSQTASLAQQYDNLTKAPGTLDNPIEISIKSPTNSIEDISSSSINVKINTKKYSSGGIEQRQYVVINNGIPDEGITVIISENQFTKTINITILKIDDFSEDFEAIENIIVDGKYSTVVNSVLQTIPSTLISIEK